MENIAVVLMMVIASLVANPFLSAEEVKKTKPVTEIADNTSNSDDPAESDDEGVMMDDEDQTESD